MTLRGRVLRWERKSGEGEILGDDGERYAFALAGWRESYRPERGQLVDFEPVLASAANIHVLEGMLGTPGGYRAPRGRDRVAAALLAFFLGGFGAHKFYLRKTGAGLVMLGCTMLFWSLLFPGIARLPLAWLLVLPGIAVRLIAFAEFVIYLSISKDEFQRKYVEGNRSWF